MSQIILNELFDHHQDKIQTEKKSKYPEMQFDDIVVPQ